MCAGENYCYSTCDYRIADNFCVVSTKFGEMALSWYWQHF